MHPTYSSYISHAFVIYTRKINGVCAFCFRVFFFFFLSHTGTAHIRTDYNIIIVVVWPRYAPERTRTLKDAHTYTRRTPHERPFARMLYVRHCARHDIVIIRTPHFGAHTRRYNITCIRNYIPTYRREGTKTEARACGKSVGRWNAKKKNICFEPCCERTSRVRVFRTREESTDTYNETTKRTDLVRDGPAFELCINASFGEKGYTKRCVRSKRMFEIYSLKYIVILNILYRLSFLQ